MSKKKRVLVKAKTKKNSVGVNGISERAVENHFNDALNAFEKGDLVDAAIKADYLISLTSGSSRLFHFRGLVELNKMNFSEAIKFFRRGMNFEPNSSELLDSLGTALSELGQFDDAIAAYRRVLLTDDRNPATLNNLGAVLQKKGDFIKSEKAFRDSLIYRPSNIWTLLNLGKVLMLQEKFDDAEALYQRMIKNDNQFIEGYQMLGECLMAERKWEDAVDLANRGIAAGLESSEMYCLKGYALGALMRFNEAELTIGYALEKEPNNEQAQIAKSILCFYQEKWPDAWKYYEARWGLPTLERRPFTQPQWTGQNLKDKKLLIWGEQGVGDEVMYASMLSDVIALGAEITFEMDERLVPVFVRSFPQIKCTARCLEPSDYIKNAVFDYQIPVASLGQFLRRDEESFGDGNKYLESHEVKREELLKKYRVNTDLLIGIAWYSSDSRGLSKSLSLDTLKPLFDVPKTKFIDLQYGDHSIERRAFEKSKRHSLIHDASIDQLKNIDDFVAQISALDLVITISNTTAHISGALGKPTWVILGATPMQRWLKDRSDCLWYSSVELFRQRKEDDAAYVVDIIKKKLEQFEP